MFYTGEVRWKHTKINALRHERQLHHNFVKIVYQANRHYLTHSDRKNYQSCAKFVAGCDSYRFDKVAA